MTKDTVVRSVKLDANGQPITSAPAADKPQAAQAKVMAKFLRKDATKEFTLEWPLEFEGVEYETLTLRVLQGSSLERWQEMAPEFGANAAMIAVLCDVPGEVAAAMAADDLQEMLKEARPFMPRSMRQGLEEIAEATTGDTPSSPNGTSTPESSPVSSDGPSPTSES